MNAITQLRGCGAAMQSIEVVRIESQLLQLAGEIAVPHTLNPSIQPL